MEESEAAKLERVLEVALNPIGSLALRERLDGNRDALIKMFDIVCPRAVQLILSESGFRIIESFLNANIDEITVRLAASLTKDWSGMKEAMGLERGRYVYETLLKRDMKELATRIITIMPKDWWFKNASALPVLIKAIAICDVEVAKAFIDEKIEAELCDTPEGLYCVLKVKGKSVDEFGWSDSFSRLILLKARSTEGSEALVQAIVYGDYLVKEMIEALCCRRESFDDCSTVTLLVRVIEKSSADQRRLIVKCLCEPNGNPIIRQIRDSTKFAEFKRACDAHFTAAQKKRLDDHLAAVPMASVVDECLQKVTTRGEEEMDTTRSESQNNKRRAEPPVTSQSAAKKSREEVAESQPSTSKTTVPNATVSEPAKATVPPASKDTVLEPATASVPAAQKNIVPEPLKTTVPSASNATVPPVSKDTVSEPSKATVPAVQKDTVLPVFMITVPPVHKDTTLVPSKNTVLPSPKDTVPPLPKIIVPSPSKYSVPPAFKDIVPKTPKDIAPGPSNTTVPPVHKDTVLTQPQSTVSSAQKDTVAVPSETTTPVVSETIVPSASKNIVPLMSVTTVPNPTKNTVSSPSIPFTIPPFIPSPEAMAMKRTFPGKKNVFYARPEDSFDNSGGEVPSKRSSLSSTIPIPSPAVNKPTPRSKNTVADKSTVADPRIGATRRVRDEGKDMIARSMNSKYRSVIWHLDNDTYEQSPIIFNDIKNGLMSLMMHERGREVIKWFLANGSFDQRGTIENRVFENVDTLVEHGGYGGAQIVQIVIEQCAAPAKKKQLQEKYARAMQSVRDSNLVHVDSGSDIEEIEVISEKINTPTAEGKGERKGLNEKNRGSSLDRVYIPRAVGIPKGVPASPMELREIREMFKQMDARLIHHGGRFTDGERKHFISVGKIESCGVAQEFIDLAQERMSEWTTKNGRSLLKSLFIDKDLRPYLVAPAASNLHLFCDEWGQEILEFLLSQRTRESFYDQCFLGNEDSPFVKLFRSEVSSVYCVNAGLKIARADPDRFRDLIYPVRGAIAETEKGRRFIEKIADLFEWNELLNTLPSANLDNRTPKTINLTSSNESIVKEEEAITTAQPTVADPREDTVAAPVKTTTIPSAAPSIFSAQPSKIQFGPNLPIGDTSKPFLISKKEVITTTQPTFSSSQENVVAAPVDTTSASQSANSFGALFGFNNSTSSSTSALNFSFRSAPVETTTIPNAPSIFSVKPSAFSFGSKESNGKISNQDASVEEKRVSTSQPMVSSSQENTVAAKAETTTIPTATPSIFPVQPSTFSFGSKQSNGETQDLSVEEKRINALQSTAPSSQENAVATVGTTAIPNSAPSIFSVQPSKILFGPRELPDETERPRLVFISEKQAITTAQSTASSQENAGPSVVRVVTGQPASQWQSMKICQMFTEVIDRRLIGEAGKLCDDEIKQLIAVGKIKGGGVAQEFIDLLLERVPVYKKTINGRRLLRSVFADNELRPYLVAPMASNLRLVSDYWGHEILGLLLSQATCEAFYQHCFLGNEDSPFVKFFRSDANKYEVVQTGMKIAGAYCGRFLELILPLRGVISETEKGRQFIGKLACFYGWTELREPLPYNPAWQEEMEEDSQAITTAQPTVSSSQENTVAAPVDATTIPNSAPSFVFAPPSKISFSSKEPDGETPDLTVEEQVTTPKFTFSPPQKNTGTVPVETASTPSFPSFFSTSTPKFSFGSKEFKGFSAPLFSAPLFLSPLITLSPSGAPSFPVTPRRTPLPVNPLIAATGATPLFIQLIVKKTVEDMVSKVVSENQ